MGFRFHPGRSVRSITLAVVFAAIQLSIANPVRAQEPIPVSDPALAAEVDHAERLGRVLWLYDQAAWHATDALFEEVDPSTIKDGRGYVVVPSEIEGYLDTIFVVEREGRLREFARYSVRESNVVGGGLVEGDLPPLSPLAERLFRAREPAIAAMVAEEYGLCSESQPNTLVLSPDEDGIVSFYLLTSTLGADSYPIGGHYRADISPSGDVVSTRRFMNTCFDLPTGPLEGPDGSISHPGVSYLFGDAPSEIHVFASFQFENGFMVIAPSSRKLWLVQDGKITLMQEEFDPAT